MFLANSAEFTEATPPEWAGAIRGGFVLAECDLLRKLLASLVLHCGRADVRWRAACAASILLHLTTLVLVASYSVSDTATGPVNRVASGWTNAPDASEIVGTVPMTEPGLNALGGEPGGASGALFATSTVLDMPRTPATMRAPPGSAAGPVEWYGDAGYRARIAENLGTFDAEESVSGTGVGTGTGSGKGSGNGGGEFFGIQSEAQRTVFVVDSSRSMNLPHPEAKTRFKRLKLELLRAVQSMGEGDTFFIIFFNDKPIPMPATGLQPAAAQASSRYLQWMSEMRADGDTDPREALALALTLRPDVVYFLTDGDFKFGVARDLARLTQARSAMHTIAFGNRDAEKLLKAMAAANGGKYRFVP